MTMMFCPFCGSETTLGERDERCCTRTGALFSFEVSAGLFECFVERSREPRTAASAYRMGGTWFCPGCGDSMSVTEHHVRCARCELSLDEFVHQLVEFNPHPANTGTSK